MHKHHFVVAVALICLVMLSACSQPETKKSSFGADSITQAYNSPGMVDLKPYTRTIFSSTDF